MNRITDNVYIGDIPDGRNEELHERHDIDVVFNVSGSEFETTDVWRPLKDGFNDQPRFDATIEDLKEIIARGDTVLVHCAAGVSRASTVTATSLASLRDIRLMEALEIVKTGEETYEGRAIANPNQKILRNARAYLGERNE